MLRALGHLAARELGIARADATPSLAPRLPSRYEPVDDAAPVATDPVASREASRRAEVEASPAPMAATVERIGATHGVAAEPASPNAPVAAPAVVAHAPVEPAMPQEPPRRVSGAPSPLEPARTPRRPVTAAPSPASLRAAAPARDDHASSTPRARADASNASLPAHPLATTPAREDIARVREGVALQPLLPPRIPARSPAPAAVAPVHVTIGRIEIRAKKESGAQPATAPRRADSPNLAAYLRRRSEGGRS